MFPSIKAAACASLFLSSAMAHQAHAASVDLGAAGDFTILGLNDGEVIINSSRSITGNVGYSSGVTSNTNQKVDSFDGAAFVHSDVNSFDFAPATFDPTGGILDGASVNTLLDQANNDAAAASAYIAGLSLTQDLGDLGDNDDVNLTAGVYQIGDWSYKEDTMTLTGSASDTFLFNVFGKMSFDASTIALSGGVLAENVIFNFIDAVDIKIGKQETTFNGTILAMLGSVDYHNPAIFNGRILARNINLHSDFNMTGSIIAAVPVPASLPLLMGAIFGLGLVRRRLS